MNIDRHDKIQSDVLTKTASNIMSVKLVTTPSSENMLVIAKKMKSCRVSAIFLTDSSKEKNDSTLANQTTIIGIVTQSDLVDQICANNTVASMLTAQSVMSPVISVSEDTSIEEVAQVMIKKRIRHLAVCQRDNFDRVLGIITGTDLANYLKLRLLKSQNGSQHLTEELALADALSIPEPLPSGTQDPEC